MHSPDSNPKQSTSPQAEPEGRIQKGVGHIGNLCAWTMPALTLLVVTQVLLRYAMEYIPARSEEHTSELQSLVNLVCRLLLEKKKNTTTTPQL